MLAYSHLPKLAEGRKKKWSYGSLFFSLFYFVPLFFLQRPDLNTIVFMIIGYALFVALYIATLHQPMRTLPIYIMALLLLGCAISLFNPGGAIIFGFLAFIVGYYYPFKHGAGFIAFIVLSLVAIHVWGPENQGFFILASALNNVVLFAYGVMERKETLHQLKRDEQAAAIETLTSIAERERIGRDLHDVAGHALSSISLKAQLADKLLEKQRYEQAQHEVKELATLSSQLLAEIREAISGIKQRSLEQELTPLLAKLSDNGIQVTSTIDRHALQILTPIQETHIALIVKEVITNILRHSAGKQVKIAMTKHKQHVALNITDNGSSAAPVEGNGLFGIKERAGLIGASVTFSWGESTSMSLSLPTPR